MNTREKPPIICSVCKQEHCAPCGKFATIDYKTRTGVCRGCAAREAGGRRLEAGNSPAPPSSPTVYGQVLDNIPTLAFSGWGNEENHAFLKKYAQQIGCRYHWNGLKNNVHHTGEQFKKAAMVAIWNGKQFTTPLIAELCRKRNIPHFFFEYGMLPQEKTFFVDPKGFCGDSILNGNLDWVTDEDMQRLYDKRAELQKQHPLKNEGFILAPLQTHNDAQVLYYSHYRDMNEFIADVEAGYPDDRIIVRPHPKGEKSHVFTRAEEIFEGDFLSWAARSSRVVAITSTCLYEAAVLGVPVTAFGDHPFKTHPPELHDKVAAGALALCVQRDGEIKPILDRFGIKPIIDKKTTTQESGEPDKYSSRKRQTKEWGMNFPQKDDELRPLCDRVQEHNPKVLVEIGTRHGSSLWMLTHYAPKDALIVAIDLAGGKWGHAGSEIDRQRVIEALRVEGREVHLIDGNSQDEKTAQELKSLLSGREIDFLFIDADHTYKGVLRDWELYHPLMADGGLVAFHDILESAATPRVKVFLLWRVLKTLFPWQEFTHDPNGAMGIGVIEYKKRFKGESS